jgi:hypothetical protein
MRGDQPSKFGVAVLIDYVIKNILCWKNQKNSKKILKIIEKFPRSLLSSVLVK